jgi:hypothetical protein
MEITLKIRLPLSHQDKIAKNTEKTIFSGEKKKRDGTIQVIAEKILRKVP